MTQQFSEYHFSTAQLDALRTNTDAEAEKVLKQLFNVWNIDETRKIFRNIPQLEQSKDLPAFLLNYLKSPTTLPNWIDLESLEKGRLLFADFGREIILALLTRSLPMCYICANGAEVLQTTTRLIDFPSNPRYERRLLETLQFIVNTCDDKGFTDLNNSWITIKKIRLIHATIRKYIQEKIEWNVAKFGEPINQEDQLMTLSAFCIQVVKALENMGIYFDENQKAHWCHLWKVTGYFLGVEETYLPSTYTDFEIMSQRIYASQAKESDAGKLLTASCVNFMASLLPFKILNAFSYSVFKYINEPQYRQMLGLTKTHWFWDRVMPWLMKTTLGVDQKLEKKSFIFRFLIRLFNKWLINGILKMTTNNEKYFYLPNHLK
jgi:hypothetical protein